MSDLGEYEQRIGAALARLASGIEALAGRDRAAVAEQAASPVAAAAPDALTELREALEAERATNAQLSERVRAIREKQESTLGALERKLAAANREQEARMRDLARLKRANADLLAANRSLVEAAASGVADPHLVNRAMQAELESLRAERGADLAEIDDILAALEPLVVASENGEDRHA